MLEVQCEIWDLSITIIYEDAGLIDYLEQFYSINRRKTDHNGWKIDCCLRTPEHNKYSLTYCDVYYYIDLNNQTIYLRGKSLLNVKITLRKLVRELFMNFCEFRNFTMLHSSAIYNKKLLLIFAGEKGAGKTTLALDGILRHDFRLLSNDHLIILLDKNNLIFTSLPTFVSVKIGSFLHFKSLLPYPIHAEEFEIEKWEAMPKNKLMKQEYRLYYTLKQLGQPNLPFFQINLGKITHNIWVIFPRFTSANLRIEAITKEQEVDSLLGQHERSEWVYNNNYNPQIISYNRRTPEQFILNSQQITRRLASIAKAIYLEHEGNIEPLLNYIYSTF
jgi:hypothetical protein